MNVKDMSTEDIERRLGEVTAEIAEIKAQIGEAKGYAAETGEYSDTNWFHRANLALRLKGREHQVLQLEFGRRRKDERRAHNATIERAFVEAARTRLDYATFRAIMDEATITAECAKNTDYPECSGNHADCPENEGYGCCEKHSPANV